MKLSHFLTNSDFTPTSFAEKIGTSVVAVYRYMNGTRRPTPELMTRISLATDGKVTANDFYQVEAPSVVTVDAKAEQGRGR